MVLLQEMRKKPATIMIGKDLNEYFNVKVMSLTEAYEEVTVVFDTHKSASLKTRTREKERMGKDPVQFNIKDGTNISHVPMSRF